MDGNGDGEHNGPNQPLINMHMFLRGNGPPLEQRYPWYVEWIEILLRRGMPEDDAHELLQLCHALNVVDDDGNPIFNDVPININDVNHENNDDDEGDDENNSDDGNEDDDENSGDDGNEDDDENSANFDDANNLNADMEIEVDNLLPGGSESDGSSDSDTDHENNNTRQDRETVNHPVRHAGASAEAADEDPMPGPSREWPREHDTDEDERSSDEVRWWESDGLSDSDSDCDTAEAADKDPLPGPSRKRLRKHDRDADEDEDERSNKRVRWWKSDSLSDSDSDCENNNARQDKNTVNCPVGRAGATAKAADEDPLPGPSRKCSSRKKSRRCYELLDSKSDTVTPPTSHDPPHSICNLSLPEDAGAVEETEQEVSQQMEADDPRPGCSRKETKGRR